MLCVCVWVWNHLLECEQPSRGHLTKENWFFLLNGPQLPIAPHICVWLHKSFPNRAEILSGLTYAGFMHVATAPGAQVLSHSANTISLQMSTTSGAYNLCMTPSPMMIPEPWGKGGVLQMPYLELRSLLCLILYRLALDVHINSYSLQKEVLWWVLRDTLIYR